jgi:dTDP-4-dehydrorhamnose 3,5-epimerase
MRLTPTALPGVLIVEPAVFGDDRGWFMESFNEPRWEAALREAGQPLPRRFVQDNHSCSRAGVLRGLHYQLPPHAQGKLVRVVAGAAWDVAVDIRRGSPTFGRWVGVELSAANRRQLWVPEGFAHGFLALQDETHFLYKTTDVYARDCERAIRWDDPSLAIDWPLAALSGTAFGSPSCATSGRPLTAPWTAPLVAPKDAAAPLLAEAELPPFTSA